MRRLGVAAWTLRSTGWDVNPMKGLVSSGEVTLR